MLSFICLSSYIPVLIFPSHLFILISHHEYQNELIIDLANEFVTFVQDKYPGNQLLLLEALKQKIIAIAAHMANNSTQPELLEEGKETAKKILSEIGEMKAKGLASNRILGHEALALLCSGGNTIF